MSTKPRLTYFTVRGLAEVTRLALNAAKIEYDEVYLQTREEFLQLIADGKLLFKQVPLLEIDGHTLVGSIPILRYVCNKYNFQGKSDEQQVMVEMLLMGASDMMLEINNAKFRATTEKRQEMLQNAAKQCKDRYLPVFEKVLSGSKSGFLVGDSLTMVDFRFFDGLCYVQEAPELNVLKPMLDDFPNCKAFLDHFSSQPGIKEYLASPRRNPPIVVGDESWKVVSKVLDW